jgi:hypothetical protein
MRSIREPQGPNSDPQDKARNGGTWLPVNNYCNRIWNYAAQAFSREGGDLNMKKHLFHLAALMAALALALVSCSGSSKGPGVKPEIIPITSLTISYALNGDFDGSRLNVGQRFQCRANISPSNATETVVWRSSNEAVATVDANGVVYGRSLGSAHIMAASPSITAYGGDFNVCPTFPAVFLDKTDITIGILSAPGYVTVQEYQVLTLFAQPVGAPKKVDWKISGSGSDMVYLSNHSSYGITDPSCQVAVVATWRPPGQARITATETYSGMTAHCDVTIVFRVATVELDKTLKMLHPGQQETLNVAVGPENATDKTVRWTTSDSGVATVSDAGLVTALAPGRATIYAISNDLGLYASCQISVQPADKPVVYVTGTDIYSVYMKDIFGRWDYYDLQLATLWINGEQYCIGLRRDNFNNVKTQVREAYSVSVSDGKIYVSTNGGLWIDGVQVLEDYQWADLRSVFVSSGDIYVAGHIQSIPYFWKNGERKRLSEINGRALSVFEAGGNVYVAGYLDTRTPAFANHATLWKNGEAQYLTDGSQLASADSVFVAGSDVYVAGFEMDPMVGYQARVWKNGEAMHLADGAMYGSFATSVSVSGGDVYVLGVLERSSWGDSVVWKNGNILYYINGQAPNYLPYTRSIFVHGGDVYVAGGQSPNQTLNAGGWIPTLWKNGVPIALSNGKENPWVEANFVLVQ